MKLNLSFAHLVNIYLKDKDSMEQDKLRLLLLLRDNSNFDSISFELIHCEMLFKTQAELLQVMINGTIVFLFEIPSLIKNIIYRKHTWHSGLERPCSGNCHGGCIYCFLKRIPYRTYQNVLLI